MGHAQISPGRDQSEASPAHDPGWRAAAGAYLQDLAGSGNFPNLAALGAAGLLHNDHDEPHLRNRPRLAPHRHRRRHQPGRRGAGPGPPLRPRLALLALLRRIPRGSGRGGAAAHEQHARGARRDLVSFVDEDARVLCGHRDASRARTHRTRPVRQEDVQHLGHADAVGDVDAEMQRPPLVQRAGGWACRVSLQVIWEEKAISQAAGFPVTPGACRRHTVLFPLSAGARTSSWGTYEVWPAASRVSSPSALRHPRCPPAPRQTRGAPARAAAGNR